MQDRVESVWEGAVKPPLYTVEKPRRVGLTMVIDKGLGPAQFTDLLLMAAEHIDFIKLAFGTSLTYPPGMLESKISLACSHNVDIYPGGTLLEIAVMQGTAEKALDRICQLGFTAVEISEGVIPLPVHQRRTLIALAKERGLRTLSEVGKKDKSIRLNPAHVQAMVAADLQAGAEIVIIEGRDFGKGIGVYNDEGVADDRLIDEILAGVESPDRIMWEAPQVAQQQRWILKLGNQVNLGNVQPEDAITLAATRAALRGDTLRVCVEREWNAGK